MDTDPPTGRDYPAGGPSRDEANGTSRTRRRLKQGCRASQSATGVRGHSVENLFKKGNTFVRPSYLREQLQIKIQSRPPGRLSHKSIRDIPPLILEVFCFCQHGCRVVLLMPEGEGNK
ncbi:unnamed protein product [Arctogadus glacialis]